MAGRRPFVGVRITCELAFGSWVMTRMGRPWVNADGLLAYVEAQLAGKVGLANGDDSDQIDIPVELEPSGRFHLITSLMPVGAIERKVDHKIRRFPLAQAFRRGAKTTTIDTAAGATKDFRVPTEVWRPASGLLECRGCGDPERIRQLLTQVGSIGERRASGYGAVFEWRVEPHPWSIEDLVSPAGAAMRPLPLDWPGLASPRIAVGRLTYPYWITDGGTGLVAVPA